MLLTQAIRKKLPKLYSQEKNPNALAIVKFFDPTGSFTWFATEFDGEDLFFGKVFSQQCPEGEFGNFRLSELLNCKQGQRGLGALPIERDRYFRPKSINEINQRT